MKTKLKELFAAPEPAPSTPPPPVPLPELFAAFTRPQPGPSLTEVAAECRARSKAELVLARGVIPFTTGTTGNRCAQLRDLVDRVIEEK